MLHPSARARRARPSHQTLLKSTVLSFYHPICLRVVGGSPLPVDAQRRRQLRPEIRSELSALVCDHCFRHAEAGNPMPNKGSRAGLGSHVRQRDRLQPPGVPVYNSQIKVEGRKTPVRHLEWRQRSLRMLGNFGTLTSLTGTAERLDGGCHSTPNKSTTQVPQHGVAAGMGNTVRGLQEIRDKGKRNHRPRGLRGHTEVAEDLLVTR